ncbi:amidohydrolase family protein [Kibdelosporangium philippinense]|uniref:Amidohydrolase family protein n=1 Tax=Kibdelosporangium philippinense TaxID=211113 RepID=A0ABS8ZYW3_9PSEU|nr:amidohydrolase family protein [Kibdelosporangium philippinense]
MDLVLTGGRVIDPESGFDEVADVGIAGDRVVSVSTAPLECSNRIDVSGLVVCPGFIDLHSHGQAIPEQRLQALDGVTTALELEAGTTTVAAAYAHAASQGRPLNYGYATSWALARMIELIGATPAPNLQAILKHLGNPAWQVPASVKQRARIFQRLYQDLADGALGIGILVGYAPQVDPDEFVMVAGLAAQAGVPTYTHARPLIEVDPGVPVDGASEIIRAAGETGAHMHYCHVNSTSARRIEKVRTLLDKAQAEGAPVSVEAYPYGAGSTAIGAAFLAPEALKRSDLKPSDIVVVATGERIADEKRLLELRAADPGALVMVYFLDETNPVDHKHLERALTYPGGAIASDAVPLTWPGQPPPPMTWPLPPGTLVHPRSAGTFAKVLRTLWRESGLLSLPEAIARCSLIPAQILEKAVPAMCRKGRLTAGSDADVLVFDPVRIADQATYVDGVRPSVGVVHLLVNGSFVVRDSSLVLDSLPGRPVRASMSLSANAE